MDPLFQIPENLADLTAEELQQLIDETLATLAAIGSAAQAGDVSEFVSADRPVAALRAEMEAAAAAVAEAREILASFESAEGGDDGGEGAEGDDGAGDGDAAAEGADGGECAEGDDGEGADEGVSAEDAAELAAIATEAAVEPEPAPAPVVAAAQRPATRRRPARSKAAAPQEIQEPSVALVAAAGADRPAGYEFPSEREIAAAMIERRRAFGLIAEGDQDKVKIARAQWSHLYDDSRDLVDKGPELQDALIAAVIDHRVIQSNFAARRKADAGSLTASGGLCAPVTPYYNLMMISGAERPVRAALPAFNADRGGLKYAQPASLAAITSGVAAMTVAQDQAGGTTGTKSCQVVDCPPFVETDVEILYHCLRFGNLGARTFPERVAQWNNLVLAAHARLGERTLLTGIDTSSTAVTAASLGLGASADLLSQVLVAGAGYRSRHRMDPNAVLRVMFPKWVQELIVSDVYRSQFQRWDMTPERFVALLRAANVEPTFYIDSAAGKGQEFGTQSAGALLPFPSTVTWYLFAEGTFLYLDGGVLELGLVRDSVLNSTNDFEIFGESFENVANIGVESLAVTSTLCDSGITAGTHNTVCPIDYSHTS
jgi:hypothetical protein